jgi:U2 small nuclear ribonucleoprotein A'
MVFTSNRISNLADVDPLGKLTKLESLSLLDNPITKLEHYRHWVIWRCQAVRFLDFQKVKLEEREKAEELFGTDEEMTELAKSIAAKRSVVVASGEDGEDGAGGVGGRVKLTKKERKRVEEMIRKAKSLVEIERLERELREGRVPGGSYGDDEDEEEDSDEEMDG